MFRKLLLAGAAALSLVVPSVSTSSAQAGSFGFDISYGRGPYGISGGYSSRPYHGGYSSSYRHQHHAHFKVLYRDCCDARWSCYGHYDCERDAYRTAGYLRHRGYNVRVSCD